VDSVASLLRQFRRERKGLLSGGSVSLIDMVWVSFGMGLLRRWEESGTRFTNLDDYLSFGPFSCSVVRAGRELINRYRYNRVRRVEIHRETRWGGP